jgi:hypothetical protein
MAEQEAEAENILDHSTRSSTCVKMSMPTHEAFDPAFDENISARFNDWIESIEALFGAIEITSDVLGDEKKYGLLIHYMGSECRKIIKRLESNGSETKSYRLAKAALKKHFAPQQKSLYLMNQFLTTQQKESEHMTASQIHRMPVTFTTMPLFIYVFN